MKIGDKVKIVVSEQEMIKLESSISEYYGWSMFAGRQGRFKKLMSLIKKQNIIWEIAESWFESGYSNDSYYRIFNVNKNEKIYDIRKGKGINMVFPISEKYLILYKNKKLPIPEVQL